MTIVITLGDLILLIFMTVAALYSILYALWLYAGEQKRKRKRKKRTVETEIYYDDSQDDDGK
jgi:flagellar basal body-associated protein FliL